jgi:hypothetical protein
MEMDDHALQGKEVVEPIMMEKNDDALQGKEVVDSIVMEIDAQ